MLVKGYRVLGLEAEWDDVDREVLWRLYRLPDDRFLLWSSEAGVGETLRAITKDAAKKLVLKWRAAGRRELEQA